MQRILDETLKTHVPFFSLLPFCRHKKVTQKRLNEMNSRRLEVIRCAHETAFGLVLRLCSDSISFIRKFQFYALCSS